MDSKFFKIIILFFSSSIFIDVCISQENVLEIMRISMYSIRKSIGNNTHKYVDHKGLVADFLSENWNLIDFSVIKLKCSDPLIRTLGD